MIHEFRFVFAVLSINTHTHMDAHSKRKNKQPQKKCTRKTHTQTYKRINQKKTERKSLGNIV